MVVLSRLLWHAAVVNAACNIQCSTFHKTPSFSNPDYTLALKEVAWHAWSMSTQVTNSSCPSQALTSQSRAILLFKNSSPIWKHQQRTKKPQKGAFRLYEGLKWWFFHCMIFLHFSCLTQSAHENPSSQRFVWCTAVRTKEECGETKDFCNESLPKWGKRSPGLETLEIRIHFEMAKRVPMFLWQNKNSSKWPGVNTLGDENR